MNVGEIINQVRIILQEPTDDFYTRSELLSWINEGQKQFCLLSHLLHKNFEITATAGVKEYSFPAALLKVEYVSYNNLKLSRVDIYELQLLNPNWEQAVAGKPTYYYFPRKRVIALYPPPDSSLTLRIIGVSSPAALVNDTDVPEIPDEYHPTLVNYTLYKAKLKDNSLPEATSFLTLFNNSTMQARIEGRWQDKRDKKFSFYPAIIVR